MPLKTRDGVAHAPIVPGGLATVLVEMTLLGLGQALRTRRAEGELDRRVAVLLLALDLRDEARPGLDDRDRDRARVVEDLGHAQLRPEDPLDVRHELPTA